MITKDKGFVKIIHFYDFHRGFSIVVTPPEAG